MDENSDRPVRIMNFVSEDQLVEAKRTRGERVDDGTAQRDRPLYEILKENKDKKDAEFNERFKHRPPKALDEDETEFLDNYEASRREYDQKVADEEAEQIRSFQAAVAAQSNIVHEVKEKTPLPKLQEEKSGIGKKNPASRPLGMIIKVKPQTKKAKVDEGNAEDSSKAGNTTVNDKSKSLEPVQSLNGQADNSRELAPTGLVQYSDESDDDL
ncbi:PSME3-interacting protein [Abrus precatorius]|uniref:PSME3-interacting protein n=1 Tax=Abrus precatorius TaxID=3816 RepID=A0A8B8L8Y0_ABRPR|nr:PSME3-interacting protein [Abrus precatorius]